MSMAKSVRDSACMLQNPTLVDTAVARHKSGSFVVTILSRNETSFTDPLPGAMNDLADCPPHVGSRTFGYCAHAGADLDAEQSAMGREPPERLCKLHGLGHPEVVRRDSSSGRARQVSQVEIVYGSWQRTRPHGVDDEARFHAVHQLDQPGAGTICDHDLRPDGRVARKLPRRHQTTGVIPERASDADDADDAGVEHTGHATNSGGTPLRRGNGPDVEDASADDRGSPQERTWTSVTRRGRWMRFVRSSSKKSAARRWVDGHLGASSPRAPLSALFTLFART